MNIAEAKQRRQELERTLSNEIDMFMINTGLRVEAVDYNPIDISSVGDEETLLKARVSVRIVL